MHPISKGFMIATAVATMAIGGSLQAMAQDKAQSEPVEVRGRQRVQGQGRVRDGAERLRGRERLQGQGCPLFDDQGRVHQEGREGRRRRCR